MKKLIIPQQAFEPFAELGHTEVVIIRKDWGWIPAILATSKLDGAKLCVRPMTQRGDLKQYRSLDAAARWLESMGIMDWSIMPAEDQQIDWVEQGTAE